MTKTTETRAAIIIGKFFYCGVILACFFNSVQGWSASQAPSLSVGDMIDVMEKAAIPRGAIRGQFLSELVQSYECTLQTRWYGLEVVTEKTINEMAYMDGLRLPENEIQAADYVICGNYANKGKGVQGYIFCTSLASDRREKELSGSFETQDTLEIPVALAKETARQLSLAPRNMNAIAGVTILKDLVWVVNPFMRCAGGWGVGSSMDSKLALQVESALQQQGIVKQIVDRQALDTILKEHNMANLPEQGFERVRMLSKLKKADILLTGQVAPWKKNNRIDLFLIDSRSGCLLAARTAKDVPEKDLAETCVRLAVRLAEAPVVMPDLRPSTPAQRRREAEILVSRDHYPELFVAGGFYFTRVRSELESMINAAEGSYLLIHDDDTFVYRIMTQLNSGYHRWEWWNTPFPGDSINRYEFRTLDFMQRMACLINQSLQDSVHSASTPTPLLYRADALMYAGRYKEAVELVRTHLDRNPGVEEEWAYEIIAYSKFKLGDLEAAGTSARKSVSNRQPGRYLAQITLLGVNRGITANKIKAANNTNDVAALAVYQEIVKSGDSWIEVRDWNRYLELLLKVEGPRKALDINRITLPDSLKFSEMCMMHELSGQKIDSKKMMKAKIYFSPFAKNLLEAYTMLHIATCYADLGDDTNAMRIARGVLAKTPSKDENGNDIQVLYHAYHSAEQLCKRIEAQKGPIKDLWKSGWEVKSLDSRYRIYIVPQGPFNQNRLNSTMTLLASFYGSNTVKVLPPLPQPQLTLGIGEFDYKCAPLFRDVFKSLVVPDDALHVVIINDLKTDGAGLLCAGQMTDFDDPSVLSPVIVSFEPFTDGITDEYTRFYCFAARIINSLHYIYANKAPASQKQQYSWNSGYGTDRERCMSFSCIFENNMTWRFEPIGSRNVMCPKCQREYEQADFEKIHTDLMRYLKSVGVKIIKADEVAKLSVDTNNQTMKGK